MAHNVTPVQRLLFIGAGANGFTHEAEQDAAIYQVLPELKGRGIDVFVIDDNPYTIALESPAAMAFWQPITVDNIKKIIHDQAIDAVSPLFGGDTAVRVWAAVVQQWHKKDGRLPRTLGLTVDMLLKTVDIRSLTDFLSEGDLPVITNHLVRSQDDANDLLRDVQLPLMVRARHPSVPNTRRLVTRENDFETVIATAKSQSLTQEIVIARAINGMKEVSLQVIRDCRGNKAQVGASEDMDPIGIHSVDSLSVSPVLTLQDQTLQRLRAYAFRAADLLDLCGVMHIRFAVDDATGECYIIKVVPYLTRMSMRMSFASGYPIAFVAINLALGIPLEKIVLPNNFHDKTALMEPMMDHVVVKLPLFPFDELAAGGVIVNRQLTTVQKSVGTTVGLGRTFIEALEKALRAAHFDSATFSPALMRQISDDALIQQLIHPQDNRVLLLVEALNRGYEVDELSELTGIDVFYFYQLQWLRKLEQQISGNVDDIKALRSAKKIGLSDGLIAHFWETSFDIIHELTKIHNITPTYKAIEPSAGEFPEQASQYYVTYEDENESVKIADNTVLVIGTGAFRLGDAGVGGYTTATVLSELRRLQYHTAVINNNPYDASLSPRLSDKQYLEPLEISDVMAVVAVEEPQAIIVFGNRRKLIQTLTDLGQKVLIFPKDKHAPAAPPTTQSEFALTFFYDGQAIHPLTISQQVGGRYKIIGAAATVPVDLDHKHFDTVGCYQLVWRRPIAEFVATVADEPTVASDTWLRAMPLGQMAFHSKALATSLVRLTVRALCHQSVSELLEALSTTLRERDWSTVPIMLPAQNDYDLHLQPDSAIDESQFQMGVTITQ